MRGSDTSSAPARQMVRHEGGWYQARGAIVIGDVALGEQSSVWFHGLIRGDVAPIRIGACTNLQDATIVHCETGLPHTIGDQCTVGHRAVLHGTEIHDRAMIGMGAVLLSRSVVGEEAIVAGGAVVREGFHVPPRTIVAGVPARVVRTISEAEREALRNAALRYAMLAALWADHDEVTPAMVKAIDDQTGYGPFRTDKARAENAS